jgi:hypothetical protein
MRFRKQGWVTQDLRPGESRRKKNPKRNYSALKVAALAATALMAVSEGSWAMGHDNQMMAGRDDEHLDVKGVFFSGHSLIDNPLPDLLEKIVQSKGGSLFWNQQNAVGSTIQSRTKGEAQDKEGWPGYSTGRNRHGSNINVVDEFRHPQTLQGHGYDALIITERHDLLGAMVWNDTIRYLRHFHDRLLEGNPQATTYLYHSWLDISGRENPRRWIDYERDAERLWRCVTTRINASLEVEGRSDRIQSIPAASALAELVDRSTDGRELPGISAGTTSATVERLFRDDVHLTPLGVYYVALVTYSTIYRSPVSGAWAPPGVSDEQASTLQTEAWDFVERYLNRDEPLSLNSCRSFLLRSFIGTFWTYTRDIYWVHEVGTLRAYLKWARHIVTWRSRFRRDDESNPLYFDAARDDGYWLRSP